MKETTAIIGAGAAGSMLAHRLSSLGKRVLLFDPKAPWEKPCGGMLRPETIRDHPVMKEYPYPLNPCNGIVFISIRNDRKFVPAEPGIPIISRMDLGRFLLDRAIGSGATFLREKVWNISWRDSQWTLETDDGCRKADVIVGADGVNSIVRRAILGPFPEEHLGLACGYFLSFLPERQHIIKLLDIEGYIWLFSRGDHVTAGIGAKLGTISGRELFKKLDAFLNEHFPGFKILKRYAVRVPIAGDEGLFEQTCCGDTWLLVGDAAGHVDPVTGEGIYYALTSGELAAQAILSDDLLSYDRLWKERYGQKLKERASFRRTLAFLGQVLDKEVICEFMYRAMVKGRSAESS